MKYRNFGVMFAFLTFISTLLTALYFTMVFSPDSIDENLIPSMISEGSEISSGFGYSYYLVIIAIILSLISFIVLFLTRASVISKTNKSN
jgi:hypothetical protein